MIENNKELISLNLPIGGFFHEELIHDESRNQRIPSDSFILTSGRSALNLIIKSNSFKTIYLPYYSCKSLLSPIIENGLNFKFYNVNIDLEIEGDIKLGKRDILIYINYFGLKTEYIIELQNIYKDQLIVDNTQAFFSNNQGGSYFNSCRKFFGVPDGCYFRFNGNINYKLIEGKSDKCVDHLVSLKEGNRQLAFKQYQIAENNFTNEIKLATSYTVKVLGCLDYEQIILKRTENFDYLNKQLKDLNQLKLERLNTEVPFSFPFICRENLERNELLEKQVFFPLLWPEVLKYGNKASLEKELVNKLFPLPIDHRFGINEMKYIVNTIKEKLNV